MNAFINIVEKAEDAEYLIVVGQDTDVEDPTEYGFIRSFPISKTHKDWPLDVRQCHKCEGYSDDIQHVTDEGYLAIRNVHEFVFSPYLVGTISWAGRGPRWVEFAPEAWEDFEVLWDSLDRDTSLLVIDKDCRETWDKMSETEQYELYKDSQTYWETWAEGDTYWVQIEKFNHNKCSECDRKLEDEFVESCGGFVGDVEANEYIKAIVGDSPVIWQERF